MNAETILAELYKGTGPVAYIDSNGTVVRGFTDACGMEERAAEADALVHYMADLHEMQRQLTPLADPNRRVETRRVRRELGDRFVNLGSRANRVPANARRI